MKCLFRLIPALVLLLAGFASIDDIDMSAAESSCGQVCSKSYS